MTAPLLALFLGIAFVVVAIAVLRVHPFIALMLAAVIVGATSNLASGEEGNAILLAVRDTMMRFGETTGSIAWIIALAAVIGYCLMESGAADRIVRTMIRTFGEKNAGAALLASAFFLCIPVFFDTVFYLLIPLVQALTFRLGRHYVYFVVCVCTGALLTHSLVPPTPGPLIVVETLSLNLGQTIIGGFLMGLVPAIAALKLGQYLDRKLDIPLRAGGMVNIEDLQAIVDTDDRDLPGFTFSLLPVLLPVSLISLSALVQELPGAHEGWLFSAIEVLGYKHVAMFLGAVIAIVLMARYVKLDRVSLWKALESPLGVAGTIILITSAGGAFGGMIRQSGIGEAIAELTQGSGFSLLLLAWLVAAVMKVAQGSSTTAMITTSGIMAGIVASIGAGSLAYDPFYVFVAIAFGAMFGSWMNDSGFWVVCKMTGFTEQETLKTWTLSVSVVSLVGLVELLVVANLLPRPFG